MSQNFSPIYARTLKYEGNYSKDPNDAGGETYKGISRVFWPKWVGWQVIDSLKLKPGFPQNLEIKTPVSVIPQSANLQQMVKDFYYENFWMNIGGERIINDKVAGQIYDTAVNMGIKTAIKLVQGVFKLEKTGILDIKTMQAINGVQ